MVLQRPLTWCLEATAVVGSESKVKYLEERFPDWPGLSILVRGKEKEYGAQLKALGYEYDLCLESLGGKYLTGALDSLAPMGRLTERDELMAQELEDMLTKGGLGDRPPAVGAEFEWERLPDALEHLKSGKSVGKVVVTVET